MLGMDIVGYVIKPSKLCRTRTNHQNNIEKHEMQDSASHRSSFVSVSF
jgi:hypothetical protein